MRSTKPVLAVRPFQTKTKFSANYHYPYTRMIETSRLKLVPLTHEQLILYKTDPISLANELGVTYSDRQHDPSTIEDVSEALEFWLTNTLIYPHHFEWYTNWEIILKEENVAIGGIGFTGLPDEEGKSMVGYGLDLRYHGKGYASEALEAIITWAFQHPQLVKLVADTPLNNIPSQRVLIKCGFREAEKADTMISWYLPRKQ
jgi:[ribosomal protein S5]-alanine N-acetyltransferase